MMGKLLLISLAFIVLMSAGPNDSVKSEVVLKRNSLQVYVSKKSKAPISTIEEELYSSKNNKSLLLLRSKMECGQGTCTSYAFLEVKDGTYRYAGEIEGLVVDIVDSQQSSYPDVETLIRAGQNTSEKAIWKLNMKNMMYEAK